ncbi:MAG: hypothetical protein AAB699_02680 [Patescibacteria group bacterium]
MLSLIHALQKKPLRVRKQLAFSFAAALTGVVTLLWFVSQGNGAEERSPRARESPGPTAAFSEALGSFFHDAGQALASVKDAVSAVRETVYPSAATSSLP